MCVLMVDLLLSVWLVLLRLVACVWVVYLLGGFLCDLGMLR